MHENAGLTEKLCLMWVALHCNHHFFQLFLFTAKVMICQMIIYFCLPVILVSVIFNWRKRCKGRRVFCISCVQKKVFRTTSCSPIIATFPSLSLRDHSNERKLSFARDPMSVGQAPIIQVVLRESTTTNWLLSENLINSVRRHKVTLVVCI